MVLTARVARAAGLVPGMARRLPPGLRRRVLVLVAAVALLATGYLAWFRHSSLVAVEQVRVTGLTAPNAGRIEAALAAAAEDMTTLDVRVEELERAVDGFPVVKSVEAVPDFPHSMTIRVVERRPVALLTGGGGRVPVAGDGTLLPDVTVGHRLPSVAVSAAVSSGRLRASEARAVVAVAGAAPAPLLERVARIAVSGRRGIVAELGDGPELIFGDGSRPRAKWIALARVLADPSTQGASYVDVRIAERPTVGGLPDETPAQTEETQLPPPVAPPSPTTPPAE